MYTHLVPAWPKKVKRKQATDKREKHFHSYPKANSPVINKRYHQYKKDEHPKRQTGKEYEPTVHRKHRKSNTQIKCQYSLLLGRGQVGCTQPMGLWCLQVVGTALLSTHTHVPFLSQYRTHSDVHTNKKPHARCGLNDRCEV